MKVKELRQFLLNRPDDEDIKVQWVVFYRDKGITIDLRGDEARGLWKTHCDEKECVLHFQPYLVNGEERNVVITNRSSEIPTK